MHDVSSPVGDLRPSPLAAKKVSDQFGGFVAAYGRIAALDISAIAFVAAAGLTRDKAPVSADDVIEKVFGAGMESMVGPMHEFVARLANGGRPTDYKREGDDGSGEG